MWIFPSRDIHLVRNAQPNTVALRVFVQQPSGRRGTWTDASTGTHDVAFHPVTAPGTPPTMPTLTGTAGGTAASVVVTPNTVGQWIVDVEWTARDHSDPANPLDDVEHGVMRVSVHDDIAALFSGDRLISMWSGESDRQLTVYARFTGGAFEDITAHPYLKYRVDPPTLATVDPAEGRITALTAGIGTVFVSTWDDRFEFRVGLAVSPAMNAGGVPAFVEQLRPRKAKHRATLWVLAEGYQDRARFLNHAHKAVDEWLRTEPYAHLADHFAAFGVFLSSPDLHVTIGSPVASGLVTDPTRSIWEGAGFSAATPNVPPERMVNRNTIFGLMLGSRLSTPLVPTDNDAIPAPFTALFVPRSSARTIHPDPRRLGRWAVDPRESYVSFITRFLAGAGHTYGPNDRILFLVDDRLHIGTHFGVLDLDFAFHATPRHMVGVGIRHELVFPVVGAVANTPLLDRDPDPSHDRGRNDFKANVTGSVVAHELSHTYQLGDEYEDRTRLAAYELQTRVSVEIEENENLHIDRTLRLDAHRNLRAAPTTNVDVTKIKWNVHRIKKGSFVTSFVTDPPSASATSTLILTVNRDQARRWKPGERVFIRNTLALRTNVFAQRRFTILAAQVAATDPQHNTVRVSIPQTTVADLNRQLGPTPLLYVPQRTSAGADLALIDPAVLAWIAAHGPFPKPTPCGVASEKDSDDVPCPDISGFKRPSVHAQAIGLYEGGFDISCGVYRPCGRCKMRNQDAVEYIVTDPNVEVVDPTAPLGRRKKGHWAVVIRELCFVCRYMLVDLLDPSQHEWLDTTYPKDC